LSKRHRGTKLPPRSHPVPLTIGERGRVRGNLSPLSGSYPQNSPLKKGDEGGFLKSPLTPLYERGENTPIPLLRRGGRQFPSKRGVIATAIGVW